MTTDLTERGLERLICEALTGDPCDPEGHRLARLCLAEGDETRALAKVRQKRAGSASRAGGAAPQ